MSVATSLSTLRSRTRFSASDRATASITASATQETAFSDENIKIVLRNLPSGPAERFPLTVEVQQSRTTAPGPTDPDFCVASNIKSGRRVRIQAQWVDAGRTPINETRCVPVRDAGFLLAGGPGTKTVSQSVEIPAGGDTLRVVVKGKNTGETLQTAEVALDTPTDGTDGSGDGTDRPNINCPDGFVLDPPTGECVKPAELQRRQQTRQKNNGGNNNGGNGGTGNCSALDKVLGRNGCKLIPSLSPATGAAVGAFGVMFLLLLVAVSFG